MAVKIAINGFGRIGRNVFKIGLENPEVEIIWVKVKDITNKHTFLRL